MATVGEVNLVFQNAIKFLKEVRVELRKVTWPSREEMTGSTLVVIVSTLLLAFYLGLIDYVLIEGIQPTLAGNIKIWSYLTLGGVLALLFWVYRIIEK